MLKRVIESGLGWGFLPAHSIRKHVRTGRMTAVPIHDFQYPMNVQFYSKKGGDAVKIAREAEKQLSKVSAYW